MSVLVASLRAASLLAFAAPRLLGAQRRVDRTRRGAGRVRGDGAPVVANAAAFGLFFTCLFAFAGSTNAPSAPALAACGCLLASAGAALVFRARAALGSAWSLVPEAGQDTGLVTTGPIASSGTRSIPASRLLQQRRRSPSSAGPPSLSCSARSSRPSGGGRSPRNVCSAERSPTITRSIADVPS